MSRTYDPTGWAGVSSVDLGEYILIIAVRHKKYIKNWLFFSNPDSDVYMCVHKAETNVGVLCKNFKYLVIIMNYELYKVIC